MLAVQDACGGDRSALDFPDEEMQGLLRQMQREMGPMHVRVTLCAKIPYVPFAIWV